MTAATVRRAGRAELRLGAILLALTAAAWALSADRMAGMDAAPNLQLGRIDWFALTWVVMMAAMMLPVLAPMLVELARRASDAAAPPLFAAGYLASWMAAGLSGYAAIEGARSLDPGFMAWGDAGRYLAAGAIAAAGPYQLSPAKDACLRRCRERAAFLQDPRRRARLGALSMGAEHGGWCIGSSWALMAALFALGWMSLIWMALVAGLITAERVLPRGTRRGVALVLVALGTWVALAPADVPGLTVPHPAQMGGMQTKQNDMIGAGG